MTTIAKVGEAKGYMETNLRHPSLHTHEYDGIVGPNNKKFTNLIPRITHHELIVFFGIMVLAKKYYSRNLSSSLEKLSRETQP